MGLLRFITAGSVDDGKSTLIGRLLYDTNSIKLDQLETVQRQSKNKQEGEIDLALVVDGLRAEREQGITIDVAYKYLQTGKKKFIIADAPGHIQYTRNMVTGASNSNLIIILIDARQGVVEQTRRHTIIASLLKIPHVTVAINKMDMVDYAQQAFDNIVKDYTSIAKDLQLKEVTFIPVSALQGDNIVSSSKCMPWYKGQTLLHHLENIDLIQDLNLTHARFPVQYVIRPQQEGLHDYRGYSGKIVSGTYTKGQSVVVLPEGLRSKIEAVEINGREVPKAVAPQSVVIRLSDDLDISRGDVIVTENNQPKVSCDVQATLCWTDTTNLSVGKKYLLQIGSRIVRALVKEIEYKLDVNTLEKEINIKEAGLNDIVGATLKTSAPVVYDAYNELRSNGTAILIDETSNNTVAGCMLQ
jgi:sulfate adenylyltransferase subunit 1